MHNIIIKQPIGILRLEISDFLLLTVLLNSVGIKSFIKKMEIAIIVLLLALNVVEEYIFLNFHTLISPTIIQLIRETNASEASGFLNEYLFTKNTIIIVIANLFIAFVCFCIYHTNHTKKVISKLRDNFLKKIYIHFVILVIIASIFTQYQIKNERIGTAKAFLEKDYLEFREINRKYGINRYSPILRLFFSIKENSFVYKENDGILNSLPMAKVTKVSDRQPVILFFIGESAIKRHMQIYGYNKATTPFLEKEMKEKRLFVFNNAITVKNSTAIAFQNIWSPSRIEDKKMWYEEPLFPKFFKLAGYYVSFVSNQFVGMPETMADFAGGSYLNNLEIQRELFDYRNTKSYKYDNNLVSEVNKILSKRINYNMIIFHGLGQHFPCSLRYPPKKNKFKCSDYNERKYLSIAQKKEVAQYDNALLFYDNVCQELINLLSEKDAIIVYLSDHGEEIFDFNNFRGRQLNNFTEEVLKSEYEIPMWIWCSEKYKHLHAERITSIMNATNKPFMIDDVTHLLLGLAGIDCNYYRSNRDILNSNYISSRKRMIGDNLEYDYDKIVF